MKKLTDIVCLLALVLALTACAGAGDWKYEELPGDYAVWRINSREIPLVRVDADGLTAEPVVEGYVYAVAWDENTIYVQQRAEKDKGDMAYYMVALSMKVLPLNIAYATWSGAGTLLTMVIGMVLFKERFKPSGYLGLLLLLGGIIALNLL